MYPHQRSPSGSGKVTGGGIVGATVDAMVIGATVDAIVVDAIDVSDGCVDAATAVASLS